MLKKIILALCILVTTFCTACNQSVVEVPESSTESDMEIFLKVVDKVNSAESFYTVTEGKTKTLCINQQISARRYVIGDTMFKESISYSGIIKLATQVYVKGDKYLVRESEKVSSISSVVWKDTATDIGKEEYLSRYGSVILGLNNYVLNENTIDGLTLVRENERLVFTVNANVETSTIYMVKEMKTSANSSKEPIFSTVKLTVTTDSSLNVISVRYECLYKIDIAILGKVDCEEDMTEYFYGFNQTTEFPEKSFFTQFL